MCMYDLPVVCIVRPPNFAAYYPNKPRSFWFNLAAPSTCLPKCLIQNEAAATALRRPNHPPLLLRCIYLLFHDSFEVITRWFTRSSSRCKPPPFSLSIYTYLNLVIMVLFLRNSLINTRRTLLYPLYTYVLCRVELYFCSHAAASSLYTRTRFDGQQQCLDSKGQSDLQVIASKICVGTSPTEILESLMQDGTCNNVKVSQELVGKLLHRFKDDWKSALGVFRWAATCVGYEHTQEACDLMVDILGKMKQIDEMRAFLEKMNKVSLVKLSTIGNAMRRLSGAGRWEDAVRMFDELGSFGLAKNTESMNLLLDTLCKEGKVEQAREIFLNLKSHISPDASTFNIFIFGWCKANRESEAAWTIQEMKGNGFQPCVISYSIIVKFYCRVNNFGKVYELLDEMEAQGCSPNTVTYTTIMAFLSKSGEFEEALRIAQRMRSAGCKPDTLFYNALIHALARAGRLREAADVFDVEMPNTGVPRGTSTYNSMVAAYCHHFQEQKALNLLKEMETSTLCQPDIQTYSPLLKSCFRTGKTDALLHQLLDDMVRKHNLSFDINLYSLLIHGLCKANRCDWAYSLFEEMIGQDIAPRYRTCHMLLEEVKLKHMYAAAEKIEAFMERL